MSGRDAALAVLAFWSLLHALRRFLQRNRTSVLPWSFGHRRRSSRLNVSLRHVHLRIESSSYNSLHDRFAALMASKRCKTYKTAFSLFYRLGYYFSILGMIGACVILSLTCWTLASRMFLQHHTHNLSRRDSTASVMQSQGWPTVEPIIPGVTVPFSDLPLIFCAVFISQIIHELGHAIAAAIENVPIQSIGASLSLIVPSASVAFAAGAFDNASARSRSIIISAGPFHNLVFWATLSLLAKTSLDRFFWQLAYRDVTHMGRIVVDVEKNSALNGYLQPGTLITHVDDMPLGPSDVPGIHWTMPRRLQAKEPHGWCVDRTTLLESQTCCTRDMSKFSPLSCFRAEEVGASLYGCLDPLPVLTVSNSTRCSATSPCAASQVCSWPDVRERLLRLSVTLPTEKQDVILWSGPPDEIENIVTLGTLQPRFILPLFLPPLFTKFSRYLSLATLSLYIFNLLPLHLLDGHHLLETLLSTEGRSHYEYDMEAVSTTIHRHVTRTARLFSLWTSRITLGLCVLALTLTLFDLL